MGNTYVNMTSIAHISLQLCKNLDPQPERIDTLSQNT